MSFPVMVAWIVLQCLATKALGGNIYDVTSTDGKKTVTHQVRFGGGKLFEADTAFHPASKKFVYLEWMRSEEAPKPALTSCDHKTDEKTSLYRFPDVKASLPAIPSIEDMKVCGMTGDRKFEAKRTIIVD